MLSSFWSDTVGCVIGAGRLGSTLAAMLEASGILPRLLTTSSERNLTKLASRFQGSETLRFDFEFKEHLVTLGQSLSALQLSSRNLLLILSVKDDVLPQSAGALADLNLDWSRVRILHCAGGIALSVLAAFKQKGAQVGVLHPCYPVFEARTTLPGNGLVAYTYEGEGELCEGVKNLVESWQGIFVPVASLHREAYHAGNVLAAGHVVSLLLASYEILCRSGLSGDNANLIIRSLLAGLTENVERVANGEISLGNILTGPFARGDYEQIKQQRAALSRLNYEIGEIYLNLGKVGVALKGVSVGAKP